MKHEDVPRNTINLVQRLYSKFKQSNNYYEIESVEKSYQNFQEKFSPKVLEKMDEKERLLTVHGHSTDKEDTLSYWLDFKKDEEYSSHLGGIFLGSMGSFQTYHKKGKIWKNRRHQIIDTTQAIEISNHVFITLKKASDLLSNFSKDLIYQDYVDLDKLLKEEYNGNLWHQSWVHKYLYSLYPEKLCSIHSHNYLLFFLCKLGIHPKNPESYYQLDFYYRYLAQLTNINEIHLSSSLYTEYGGAYNYWVFDLKELVSLTNLKESNEKKIVESMFDEGIVGLPIKTLSNFKSYDDFKYKNFKKILDSNFPSCKKNEKKKILQGCSNFYSHISAEPTDDLVIMINGPEILGIGRLGNYSEYFYDDPQSDFFNSLFPHKRKIIWYKLDYPIIIPQTIKSYSKIISPRNWFMQLNLSRYFSFLSYIEKILSKNKEKTAITTTPNLFLENTSFTFPAKEYLDHDKINRILDILERKKQVILFGPPGTGKSFFAKISAEILVGRTNFQKEIQKISSEEYNSFSNFIKTCVFHPSFGYEEFIMGYRPTLVNDKIFFKKKSGIFKQLCEKAQKKENTKKKYVLIIDEINRGDIPRIFGEIMLIMENNKRSQEITLGLAGNEEKFSIPPNVYIIGTMNTADKSISVIDTALRRRFGFMELMPDYELFDGILIKFGTLGIDLKKWLEILNEKIRTNIRDGRDLQIGHSYLLNYDKQKERGVPIRSVEEFSRVYRDEILPLIKDYCYGDYHLLKKIIGKSFIDIDQQQVKYELFERENANELLNLLIKEDEDIAIEIEEKYMNSDE